MGHDFKAALTIARIHAYQPNISDEAAKQLSRAFIQLTTAAKAALNLLTNPDFSPDDVVTIAQVEALLREALALPTDTGEASHE